MSYIAIHICLGPGPSSKDERIVIPLDSFVVRECSQSLDTPSYDADPTVAAVFCTNPIEVKKTQVLREELAKRASEEVRRKIIETFNSADTVMGYKKNGRV